MEFCRRWGIADKVMNCPFPDDHPMDAVFVTSLGGYELARMERPARKHQTAGPLSPMNQQICSQTWFDPILRELAQSYPEVVLAIVAGSKRSRLATAEVTAEIVHLDSGKCEAVKPAFLPPATARTAHPAGARIKLIGSEVLSRPFHLFFASPTCSASSASSLELSTGDRPQRPVGEHPHHRPSGRTLAADGARFACRSRSEQIDRMPICAARWAGTSTWNGSALAYGRDGRCGGALFAGAGSSPRRRGTSTVPDRRARHEHRDRRCGGSSWKLAAAIEGWGGDSLLASYDAERRPIGERNVRAATGYFQGHRDSNAALKQSRTPRPRATKSASAWASSSCTTSRACSGLSACS